MRRALATACLLASLLVPAAAHADGDPASDVLILQDVYLPFTPQVPKNVAAALESTLKLSAKRGYPLKVAVIATRSDLGSVPQYFGQPNPYAAFLESEISFNKPKPLLIVMPSGYGTSHAGAGAAKALDGLDPPSSTTGDALGRSAIDASLRLAKAAGHPLPAPKLPKASGSGGGGSTSPAIVFGIPVLLLALGGVLASIRMKQAEKAQP